MGGRAHVKMNSAAVRVFVGDVNYISWSRWVNKLNGIDAAMAEGDAIRIADDLQRDIQQHYPRQYRHIREMSRKCRMAVGNSVVAGRIHVVDLAR